ncbi:Transporter, major facilitator family protein [Aphelenchoides fujianensis]|nr:Transporter, major facilitator family protein [Aphelenchoides fujianensis]
MSLDKKKILKQDDQQSVEDEARTEWTSIWVASILSFIGSIQFSLYASSIYPHVRILDKSMNETFFGATVAIYAHYAGIIEEQKPGDVEAPPTPAVPKYDRLAVFVCYCTRFIDMLVRSTLEAIGSPFGMAVFALREAEVVVSSGVARMVGPLGASYLYVKYGPQAVWLMEIGAIGLVLFAWIGLYRRMVPLRLTPELQRALSSKRSISRPSSVRKNSKQRVHPV